MRGALSILVYLHRMPKLRPLRVGRFVDLDPIHPRGLGLRRVRAYVPAPRKDDASRPLLVLFDGQNVFGDEGSFAGGWHAHHAIDKIARWKPTPPLVVAVDHGHHARIDELTPFVDRGRGGKLGAITDAIVKQLLPRLHERFDLANGPGGHYIGGASLGGLAALYIHLHRPEVFGGAIAMSPSLWFTRERVAAFIRAQSNPYRSRIYLDAGLREGDGTIAKLTRVLGKELRARGWRPPTDRRALRLLVRIDSRGRHDERAWRRRLPKALRFICEP
jgi:predicted alpha/beta superfamily hydrolase